MKDKTDNVRSQDLKDIFKESYVLITDDNEINRKILELILVSEGFKVITAESGSQTIELLEKFDICLVLLDLMMPGMDGFETLEIIRKKYSLPDLPVIMVTAKTEEEVMVNSFRIGVNDFISKPVNKAVVLARINTQQSLLKIRRNQLESENRFKLLSEISTEGIVIFHEDKVIEANHSFCLMYGYDYGEVIGKKIMEFYPQPEQKQMTNLFAKNSGKYIETQGVKKDGSLFYLEIIARESAYRGLPVIIANIRDISERKQYEKQREALIEELKQTIEKAEKLSGLLPICAWCKQIKDHKGYWQQIEMYISSTSGIEFSHGICPNCIGNVMVKEKNVIPALEINMKNFTVKCSGKEVNLSLGEFNIFNYLYNNPENIVSIDELLENVFKYPPGTGNKDYVKDQITEIQARLDSVSGVPDLIVWIPGKGYKFCEKGIK